MLLSGCGPLGGCAFFRNYGSGTHLDAAQEQAPKKHLTAKAASMLIDVTTNAAGQVVTVDFVRSSNSNAVDGFVADSIRREWPGGPSTRSRVQVDYTPSGGFSPPKLVSSAPVS